MPKYYIWRLNEVVEIEKLSEYTFPFSGAKVLFKVRPPAAKEVSTD